MVEKWHNHGLWNRFQDSYSGPPYSGQSVLFDEIKQFGFFGLAFFSSGLLLTF